MLELGIRPAAEKPTLVKGHPARPLLEATDTTYPALGRFGVGGNAQEYELYDDWVTVMPWEG